MEWNDLHLQRRKRFKISFFSCVLPSQAEFFGSFNSFITEYGLFKKKKNQKTCLKWVLFLNYLTWTCIVLTVCLYPSIFCLFHQGLITLFVKNISDLEITAVGQTRFLLSSSLHSVGESFSFEIHPFQHCGIISDCSHCTDILELVPSSFKYTLVKMKASLFHWFYLDTIWKVHFSLMLLLLM